MRLYSGEARAAEARGNLPGDQRTGAGRAIVPRYLGAPGDWELSWETAGFLAADPRHPGSVHVPMVGAGLKVLPFLDLHAQTGPLTRIGARGPIYQSSTLALGWSAGYRSELVALGLATRTSLKEAPAYPGVGPPLLSLPPGGYGVARGGEVRMEALYRQGVDVGFVDFSLSPVAVVLGNRSGGGADYGLDLSLDRVTVGYAGGVQFSVSPAILGADIAFQPLVVEHGVGARVTLTDRLFFQVGYRLTPADTYNNTWYAVVGGIGYRPPSVPPAETP